MLLSRPPLESRRTPVRLACFMHAASVYPEPGSNSPNNLGFLRTLPSSLFSPHHSSIVKAPASSSLSTVSRAADIHCTNHSIRCQVVSPRFHSRHSRLSRPVKALPVSGHNKPRPAFRQAAWDLRPSCPAFPPVNPNFPALVISLS